MLHLLRKPTIKNNKLTSLIILVLIILYIWSEKTAESDRKESIELAFFSAINENTKYTLFYGDNVKKGILGEFYHCIKKRRSIFDLRPQEGTVQDLKLITQKGFVIDMSAISDEVYRYVIIKSDQAYSIESSPIKKVQNSEGFAVNCSLGLLQ